MNRRLYCKEKMITAFDAVEKFNFKKDMLKVEIIEKGFIYPCEPVNNELVRTYGGVFDADYNPVELSYTKHCDFNRISIVNGEAPPPIPETIDFIDEEVVWLGFAWDFYGHFLSDSLGRLWYLLKNKNLKVCYISRSENTFLDFYRLFGLKDEQIIRVTKLTKFRRIIVPEPAFRYHDYYHDSFKDIINEITKDIEPAKYKKIYLSRSQYNKEVPTLGEKVIQDTFTKKGFKIIYPETLSLKSKIAIMKGAEIIAGTTGTNMHNILFAGDGIKSVCLNRSADILYMQLLIDEMKNIDAVYVDVYQNPLPITYHSQPYLLGITEELLKFFNDYNFNFKYKIKNDKYKFSPEIYEDFTKDIIQWLYAWTKNNLNRADLLPETLKTSDILNMMNEIWQIYDIKKLSKRKKSLSEKLFKVIAK